MAWPSLGSASPRCTRIHMALNPAALYLTASMRPFSFVRSPPSFASSQLKTSSGFGPRILDVVQPKQFWILHYFDARAPWVFHERELEEPGRLARWRDDLDTRRREFFHLRIKVREREPHMIDGASSARLRVRLFGEDKPRAAEHKPVRTLREPPGAEVLLLPVGGRCRIGHVQMDVVVGKRLRRGGAGESPQNEADESRRKHDPSQHEELLFTIGPWF